MVGEKGEIVILPHMLRKFDGDLPTNCRILENLKGLTTILDNFFDTALYLYGVEPLIPVVPNFLALQREIHKTLAPNGILTVFFVDPRENMFSRVLLKGLF
ncbi:MAG: hypothetical protein ACE5I5_16935 [Candidatus Heimdallarchaeota archaeon]